MADIYMNPKDVRDFAYYLGEMSENMKSQRLIVMGEFGTLAETLKRDARYASFERTFFGSMEDIETFLRECERYIPYLEDLARIAEEMLEDDY